MGPIQGWGVNAMKYAATILQDEYPIAVQPIYAINVRNQCPQLMREYFPTFAEPSKMMIVLEITVKGRVNHER